MILRRDFHLVEIGVQHRLISAVMSELQLEGFAAKRESHDLMTEADSEDRLLAEQIAGRCGSRSPRLRDRPDRWRGKCRRASDSALLRPESVDGTTVTRAATMNEIAENVGLDSEVVGHDMTIARLRSGKTGKLDESQRLLRS